MASPPIIDDDDDQPRTGLVLCAVRECVGFTRLYLVGTYTLFAGGGDRRKKKGRAFRMDGVFVLITMDGGKLAGHFILRFFFLTGGGQYTPDGTSLEAIVVSLFHR